MISPLLANVYLHYVFDLWAERWRGREATGDMIVVRYADEWCATNALTAMEVRNCARDEGRPLEAGLQGQASNHRECDWSKAMVVSVTEKARRDRVR